VSRTVTLVLAPGQAEPPGQTAPVSWFPIVPAHPIAASIGPIQPPTRVNWGRSTSPQLVRSPTCSA
jgi:hypothetical protein